MRQRSVCSKEKSSSSPAASAREGTDVVLIDRMDHIPTARYVMPTADDLAQTVKEGDVRSQESLNNVVAEGISAFGRIDAVIANAGIWAQGPFWEVTEDQWHEMIVINLTGFFKTVKAVAPHLIERQTGSVVLIASVDEFEASVDYVHYTAAKHGVLGLMKNMAVELAPHGV